MTCRVRTPDGTTLATRTLDGVGAPLLALHGFTGDHETMIPVIEQARGDRPALLVDIVGHGDSDAPATVEPYSMSSVVDQLLSLLGGHPPGYVHLVGYSMGGRIACAMACRAPWYFASLSLISATAGIDEPTERAERHAADLALADRIEVIGLERFVDEWLELPLFAPLVASLSPEQLSTSKARRATASALGLANSLRGTGSGAMPPLWDSLATVRTPMLALAGELDPKYVDLARRLAAATRSGRVEVVPNAGHALHLEKPVETGARIASFLEGCDVGHPETDTLADDS